MARLMSVAFTEQQVRDRTKTVTRRKGWWIDSRGRHLVKPGDRLTLCRKVMGRKKGEPLERLAEVEVMSVRRERLIELYRADYGYVEMTLEGFHRMNPRDFVRKYFTEAQGIGPREFVTRIEWRYLDEEG